MALVPFINPSILYHSSLMQTIKSTSFVDPLTNKSYTLGIYQDESSSNPFEDWNCEPPIMYALLDRYRTTVTHYGTDHIVSELLELITPRRLVMNKKELLGIIEVEEDDLENNNWYNTIEENLRSELFKWWDTLDLIEALARISKTPSSRHKSRGYSQGDYADVLIVLTPESFKKTWCKPKDATAILDHTKKLFDAYIWWDVYGYTLTEHIPLYKADGTLADTTEDIEIDSCWWFYGDDLIENGMRDNLPDFSKQHIEYLI